MQENPNSQYDFIMNAGQPGKKKLLPGPGSSKKQRIIVALAGAGILLVIIVIIFSLLFSSGGGNTNNLVLAVQKQNELIRISDIGLSKARGSDAKNLAITTKLAVSTSQQPLVKLIKNQGHKLSPQELAGGKNTKTDATLTTADQNNKFDEVFVSTMQAGIADYQKTLKTTFDETKDKNAKQTISEAYSQAKVLFPPVNSN